MTNETLDRMETRLERDIFEPDTPVSELLRAPRNRRRSARVPLRDAPTASLETPIRVNDISAGGVGFLVPREDAALIDRALVLVHVREGVLLRARVQRVDVGSHGKDWVRVGARFVDVGAAELQSLSALIAERTH